MSYEHSNGPWSGFKERGGGIGTGNECTLTWNYSDPLSSPNFLFMSKDRFSESVRYELKKSGFHLEGGVDVLKNKSVLNLSSQQVEIRASIN